MFHQHDQDLEWLFLKSDLQAVLSEFAGAKINLEDAKATATLETGAFWHGGKP
jgi:hypothetical protein